MEARPSTFACRTLRLVFGERGESGLPKWEILPEYTATWQTCTHTHTHTHTHTAMQYGTSEVLIYRDTFDTLVLYT